MRIPMLNGYTYNELVDMIDTHVKNVIEENYLDITFIEGALYGSRMYERNRPDSDLDYVFEYEGNMREDALFNIMHEEDYYIDDILVDINPIRR